MLPSKYLLYYYLQTLFLISISIYSFNRWPEYKGDDDTIALLHDLAGLASSKKVNIYHTTHRDCCILISLSFFLSSWYYLYHHGHSGQVYYQMLQRFM